MTDDDYIKFVRCLPQPTLILSGDGTIVALNAPAARLAEPVKQVGNSLHDWVRDRAVTERLIGHWSRTAQPLPMSLTLQGSDGVSVECRGDGARVSAPGKTPRILLQLRSPSDAPQFHALNQKVAELGREVLRRRRAESRLAAQLRLIEQVARSSTLQSSLDSIARYVESESPNAALASILLVEDGKLRHGSAPSLPEAYNRAVDGLAIGPGVGSCGTAAFVGDTVVVSDIATDPLWQDFKDLALEHGLHACWSTPVTSNAQVVLATVAHYYRRPRSPDNVDRQLSEVARHVVEIAIERHRVEEQLRVRALELVQINTRKNEFLAMLGHELRNPLSSMVLTLERLTCEAGMPEQSTEWIAILQRQLGLVGRLVDDLLDVSRVTQGKVELRRRVIDLRDCAAMATNTLSRDDSRVRVRLPERPVWVNGDAERLHQVVDNLVHNACKFTPADGTIDIVVDDPQGQQPLATPLARLRVVDTGAGIAAADLSHVFKLFAQSARPLHRPHGGLGIGLTLAKSLIEGHDGTIEVLSAGIGHGSEFVVHLPLCEAPHDTAQPDASVSRAPGAAPNLGILVVDDDEDSARLLSELLQLQGHSVRIAHDGPAAIEAVHERVPDLLILDIGLPLLDGFEVARRLRQERGLDSQRCMMVALTGYGQPSDHARATAAGFDEFMVKPIDLPRLQRLIRSRVEGRHESDGV